MDKQKRYSLSYRVRPTEGSLLAEVAKWLNKMSASEKNETISQVLLRTCAPLAKVEAGASRAEIERSYWEFEQWVSYHRFVLRQSLDIQGQLPQSNDLERKVAEIVSRIQAKKEKETKSVSSKNELAGEDKTIDYRQYLEQLFNNNVD